MCHRSMVALLNCWGIYFAAIQHQDSQFGMCERGSAVLYLHSDLHLWKKYLQLLLEAVGVRGEQQLVLRS